MRRKGITKGFWIVAKVAFALFAVGIVGVIILRVAGGINPCGLFNMLISSLGQFLQPVTNLTCPF